MTRRILVPFNESPRSKRALEYVCATFPDADVTVLYVVDSLTDDTASIGWGNTPNQYEDWVTDRIGYADTVFETARGIADEYGVSVTPALAMGRVHRAIIDRYEDGDFDLVVMGGHVRRRAVDLLMGDVAERLLRTSSVPVAIVRTDMQPRLHRDRDAGESNPRRILVPYNGTDTARRALEYACETFADEEITVMYVDTQSDESLALNWDDDSTHVGDWFEKHERRAEELFDEAREIAADRGASVSSVLGFGPFYRAIREYSEENQVDLVVAGARDRGGVRRYIFETPLAKVLHSSTVPVAVIQAPRAGE
ncbi:MULTISPECIES: universal stress protein [Halorussus]|uniref:universal stress protein n=1 Tax=Halorussus TaxID=1070314 RepID=UPI0020A195DF|nr:universal stress protein [Halorussus vallis]USZ78414.1 universal stress protein [Halorussus vallis]